jgi:hypothetical protein
VLRGKALALLMERAAIPDASGRPVDLDTLGRAASGEDGEIDDDAADVELVAAEDVAEDASEDASADAEVPSPGDTVAP